MADPISAVPPASGVPAPPISPQSQSPPTGGFLDPLGLGTNTTASANSNNNNNVNVNVNINISNTNNNNNNTNNANNINNNNNNNRNRNRNRNNQNPLMTPGDRLFHALFFKAALVYAQFVPKSLRRALELFILLKALLAFAILVHIHVTFLKTPATCLESVKNDWPRDGVLRVEIVLNPNKYTPRSSTTMINNKKSDNAIVYDPQFPAKLQTLRPTVTNEMTAFGWHEVSYVNESLLDVESVEKEINVEDEEEEGSRNGFFSYNDMLYVVEYSLEYGHLRLSGYTRQKLKVPVLVVLLNPATDKCFGDSLTRFLLKEFLGYDDLLMASVRVIAEQEDNKGYLRNVATGEHYRFVSMWWAPWSSYPIAFFVMILFTVSISMLLRYSHNQIFVFIVDLLEMIEVNAAARFPFAPLLTVILALVGMETIMSEFFNDTTTAFYVILIVWIADQYDDVCCHTTITKRHWLRFFYLYHFAFYAYHYRFNGQYSSLALLSSWLFIQHLLIYFFHHYELPIIIQQAQLQQILLRTRQRSVQQQMGIIGGEPATGLRNGNETQNQQGRGAQSISVMDMFRVAMGTRTEFANRMRQWVYGFGRMAPVPVRVANIRNLRRITLGSIEIIAPVAGGVAGSTATGNRENEATATATNGNSGTVGTSTAERPESTVPPPTSTAPSTATSTATVTTSAAPSSTKTSAVSLIDVVTAIRTNAENENEVNNGNNIDDSKTSPMTSEQNELAQGQQKEHQQHKQQRDFESNEIHLEQDLKEIEQQIHKEQQNTERIEEGKRGRTSAQIEDGMATKDDMVVIQNQISTNNMRSDTVDNAIASSYYTVVRNEDDFSDTHISRSSATNTSSPLYQSYAQESKNFNVNDNDAGVRVELGEISSNKLSTGNNRVQIGETNLHTKPCQSETDREASRQETSKLTVDPIFSNNTVSAVLENNNTSIRGSSTSSLSSLLLPSSVASVSASSSLSASKGSASNKTN